RAHRFVRAERAVRYRGCRAFGDGPLGAVVSNRRDELAHQLRLAFIGHARARVHAVSTDRRDSQSPLSGCVIPSDVQRGVCYRLLEQLGEGAMGVAYLAQRESEAGASPVVVKAVRPRLSVRQVAPDLIARKEAVALG